MTTPWIETTDIPKPAPEADLALARRQARSYLQCQILTCLTSVDGLTLSHTAFRWASNNEHRMIQFMKMLWDMGYELECRPGARRQFDVWWLTGWRRPGTESPFPAPR